MTVISRSEDLAALQSGEFVLPYRVIELRSLGMDAILEKFVGLLPNASSFTDTLNIYWECGLEFKEVWRVEDAVRKLVYGQRNPVVGEFPDIWLLCYPDDSGVRQSVELEIDRMIAAVNAGAGQ